MFEEQGNSAWSLYWAEDRLHSCVAHESSDDQLVLTRLWEKFAINLEANSKVLDLATGNGVVAKTLVSVQPRLTIDAVDKASIDPDKYLSDKEGLDAIRFHADTDMLSMPFEQSSFDAITSQFGIEYAGFTDASFSVMQYLKKGGKFRYIVHHADSGIMSSSKKKIQELEQLTRNGGVLDTLLKVLRGDASFAELEDLGQQYLEAQQLRTKAISGQVFAGIERVAASFATHPKESLELGVTVNFRVRSELVRLQQLILAGQTEEKMNHWCEKFRSEFGEKVEVVAVAFDQGESEYLLGWGVEGSKSK